MAAGLVVASAEGHVPGVVAGGPTLGPRALIVSCDLTGVWVSALRPGGNDQSDETKGSSGDLIGSDSGSEVDRLLGHCKRWKLIRSLTQFKAACQHADIERAGLKAYGSASGIGISTRFGDFRVSATQPAHPYTVTARLYAVSAADNHSPTLDGFAGEGIRSRTTTTPKGVRMAHRLRTMLLIGSLAAVGAAGTLVAANVAAADTTLCEQYGTTIAGQYVVQNNRWGTTATQCINATSNGFSITQQDGVSTTGARSPTRRSSSAATTPTAARAPPCRCSSARSAARPAASATPTSAAAPTTRRTTSGWTRHPRPRSQPDRDHDLVQPAGQHPADRLGRRPRHTSAGRSWEVWTGNNGGNNVVSYVATSAIS